MRIKKLPDINLSKVQTPSDYYREQREQQFQESREDYEQWIKHELRKEQGEDEDY